MSDLRILIVDDEPLARENLRLMLAHRPGCHVIGEASDVPAAREVLDREPVDLLLLDIRMPGASGLDFAGSLSPRQAPVVVFVTAHAEFAVAAFGVRATDFLLKPFDEQRLAIALERAVERCTQQAYPRALDRIDNLALQLRTERTRAHRKDDAALIHNQRLVVSDARRTLYISLDDVVWFRSSRNYVRVHTSEWWHLLRRPLQQLEQSLDPDRFVRVHRSAIVNTDHVREIRPGMHGDYVIKLSSGARVVLSRRRRAAIERLVAAHRPSYAE